MCAQLLQTVARDDNLTLEAQLRDWSSLIGTSSRSDMITELVWYRQSTRRVTKPIHPAATASTYGDARSSTPSPSPGTSGPTANAAGTEEADRPVSTL